MKDSDRLVEGIRISSIEVTATAVITMNERFKNGLIDKQQQQQQQHPPALEKNSTENCIKEDGVEMEGETEAHGLAKPTRKPPHEEHEMTAEEIRVHADVMSGRRSCLLLRHPDQMMIGSTSLDPTAPVFFFDLDNTLYSKSHGIQHQMTDRIRLFFQTRLNLPQEESASLGRRYYLDYGLAIRGVIREWDIDPADYDGFVDGGLEFGADFGPPPGLRVYLEDLAKVARLWIFTNAGLCHARRVMRLLGLLDEQKKDQPTLIDASSLFEGIIYCDYAEPDFPAKPDRLAYERAMQCAGVDDPSLCYFIDDSPSNVRSARDMGWRAILLDEHGEYEHCGLETIRNLEELYGLCNPKDLQTNGKTNNINA